MNINSPQCNLLSETLGLLMKRKSVFRLIGRYYFWDADNKSKKLNSRACNLQNVKERCIDASVILFAKSPYSFLLLLKQDRLL